MPRRVFLVFTLENGAEALLNLDAIQVVEPSIKGIEITLSCGRVVSFPGTVRDFMKDVRHSKERDEC